MTQATIDLATFEALKEAAGADFVQELVGTFLDEAPTMIGDLRSALAANDANRFRRAAHSLKSNSMSPIAAMSNVTRLCFAGFASSAGGAQVITRRVGGALSTTLPTIASWRCPSVRQCSQREPAFQSEMFSASQYCRVNSGSVIAVQIRSGLAAM